jgi:hypothetical protein
MSAFVVSDDHIDALLTFAAKDDSRTRDAIGTILLQENVRSVCHRYRDATITKVNYKFKPYSAFAIMPEMKKLAWVLKLCDCFDYQACETADYDQSEAHGIIEDIRQQAINLLPFYHDAPWGL